MSEVATSVELGERAAKRAESRMLIDGALVAAASGAEFDNVSPATGVVLGSTAAAGAADMDKAIGSARRAFEGFQQYLETKTIGSRVPRQP